MPAEAYGEWGQQVYVFLLEVRKAEKLRWQHSPLISCIISVINSSKETLTHPFPCFATVNCQTEILIISYQAKCKYLSAPTSSSPIPLSCWEKFSGIAISHIEKKNLYFLVPFQKLAINCPYLTSYYPFYKFSTLVNRPADSSFL